MVLKNVLHINLSMDDEELEAPNYYININLSNRKNEINWDKTLDNIKDRAIEKNEDNILLPIYRYAKLVHRVKYHIATILHEN